MASLAKAALPDDRGSDWPVVPKLPADLRTDLFGLIKNRSFRTGHFILSSGETSTIYFNMKQTMMYPRGAELCARALLHVVRALDADYVSGLEMGAVPVIGSMAAISSVEGSPLATTFVRKQAKSHGTKDVIEGLGPSESLHGRRVVVIDDVSTTGKSILQAIDGVRAAGGIVDHAACIVDRAEGGEALLAAHGVKLHAVFHVDEFLA